MNYKKEIIAVVDPMCSWCWGFAPVLQELKNTLPKDTKLTLCLGGLRSHGDQEWTPEFRAFLKQSWENVASKTGQSFNLALLDKDMFDYNTEPACRALVVARQLDEDLVFSFLHTLQKSFYQEAKDISDINVLIDIAEKEGYAKKDFLELFSSSKVIEDTQADKFKAQSMGANSFPSLVFIDGEGHLYVLKGYRDFASLRSHI